MKPDSTLKAEERPMEALHEEPSIDSRFGLLWDSRKICGAVGKLNFARMLGQSCLQEIFDARAAAHRRAHQQDRPWLAASYKS